MLWLYRNDLNYTVAFRHFTWLPHELHELPFPVPEVLGLSCIQEGDALDPVLLHEDIIIQPHEQKVIALPHPALSHNVALSILNLSPNCGVECRFNHEHNKPIPIDVRGFSQSLDWVLCSKVFLINSSEAQAHISFSAVEVYP